ncbi:hypothetical protein [Methylomagnum sp.]
MLESGFDQINHFLQTHPYWLAQLAFLLRIKSWLLALLMGYFLFLIYREQRGKTAVEKNYKTKAYFRA